LFSINERRNVKKLFDIRKENIRKQTDEKEENEKLNRKEKRKTDHHSPPSTNDK